MEDTPFLEKLSIFMRKSADVMESIVKLAVIAILAYLLYSCVNL